MSDNKNGITDACRSHRRKVRYPVWIDLENGAPLFARDGKCRPLCQVVGREEYMLAVRFVRAESDDSGAVTEYI